MHGARWPGPHKNGWTHKWIKITSRVKSFPRWLNWISFLPCRLFIGRLFILQSSSSCRTKETFAHVRRCLVQGGWGQFRRCSILDLNEWALLVYKYLTRYFFFDFTGHKNARRSWVVQYRKILRRISADNCSGKSFLFYLKRVILNVICFIEISEPTKVLGKCRSGRQPNCRRDIFHGAGDSEHSRAVFGGAAPTIGRLGSITENWRRVCRRSKWDEKGIWKWDNFNDSGLVFQTCDPRYVHLVREQLEPSKGRDTHNSTEMSSICEISRSDGTRA